MSISTRTSDKNVTPNDVYELAKQNKLEKISANPSIEPGLLNQNITSADFSSKTSEEIQNEIDKFSQYISQLREQDFDGFYLDTDGKKVLVKYHPESKNTSALLNPVAYNEAQVQAMRYFQGMLLIAKNTKEEYQKDLLLTYLNQNYQRYNEKRNDPSWSSTDCTLWLAEECAKDIGRIMKVKPDTARKQLVMARDLGILGENHPAICTISEYENKVTIEKSTPYKISEKYYENELFSNIESQHWLKSAKKLAGFDGNNKENWLSEFFKSDFEKVKKGVALPPSARWLPIPANNQHVEISVAEKNEDISQMKFSTSRFMRTGVPIAYDVRKLTGMKNADAEQKKIAKAILMELIRGQLDARIAEYKNLYGGIIDENNFNFHVNYQSLLSPLMGELHFNHIDNNSKFIAMVKEVMNEIDHDVNFKNEYKDKGVNLIVRHTNAAINRNAHLSNEFSVDDATRRNKIAAFADIKMKLRHDLINKMGQESSQALISGEFNIEANQEKLISLGYDPVLVSELAERERAAQCLEDLLDNKAPYKDLSRYQRNIMMAALERLVMGSQSLTLAGCKSARDRTGIFACAVKVMKENPEAMRDWAKLEEGIVLSLKQGHAFRSMIFHSAIVKVSLVHEKFMKQLRKNTQGDIKNLLVFSRKLHGFSGSKADMQQSSHVPLQKSEVMPDPGMITKQDAQSLLPVLYSDNLMYEIRKSRNEWYNKIQTISSDLNSSSNLDEYLSSLREAHLNAKSMLAELGDLQVRVYPKSHVNVNASANDFFATGIDSTRGALAVIQHAELSDEKRNIAINQTKKSLLEFHQKISLLQTKFVNAKTDEDKLVILKAARNEYSALNINLTQILVRAGAYQDASLAAKGMLEARDFLWIMSHQNEAVCTVREVDKNGNPVAVSFAKRISFPQNENGDFGNQPWFKEFSDKHSWAGAFIEAHPEVLNLSATPMQRSTPNPANAWDEASIFINNGEVQIISGCRMGISSSYQVKDKEERQRLTTQNHQLMATDQRLQAYANQHIDKWKGLLAENKIEIPILHQTLVDPGSPRYLANRSGENPRDMIKRKHNANIALQRKLDQKKIYYDKAADQIIFDPIEKTANLIEIKFVVKETNNGINIHEKVTDKVDQDITDSRDLIIMAIDKINLLKDFDEKNNFSQLSADITMIVSYLEKSNPAHPQKMSEVEKSAMNRLCHALTQQAEANPLSQIDSTTRRNLSLLIQASTDLASFLSNDTGINIIGYVRDGSAAVESSLKANDLNDATYKSCYERILAELLGVRMGGCKSALDREGEVAELTSAMYRQFNDGNRIHHYHDDRQMRDAFMEKYVNTQHKHNMCEMITATFGSSDLETLGKAREQESRSEQKLSSLFERGCRHPSVAEPAKKQPLYKELYAKLFTVSQHDDKILAAKNKDSDVIDTSSRRHDR